MPSRKGENRADQSEPFTLTNVDKRLAERERDNQSTVSAQPESPVQDKQKDKKEKEKDRAERDAVPIEDLNLPRSIITRLAKGVLAPNTQIQANAILALSKGATVFINYLANASNQHTVAANKKTIHPSDVFRALDELEFGFMREKVEAEFAKFNQVQASKRENYRRKTAAAKQPIGPDTDTSMADLSTVNHDASVDDSLIIMTDSDAKRPSGATSAARPAAKKLKSGSRPGDGKAGQTVTSSGAVDNSEPPSSDAETVPDEPAEDEDEGDVSAEAEEEEEGDGESGLDPDAEAEGDRLEEREEVDDGDEALDDDEDSE